MINTTADFHTLKYTLENKIRNVDYLISLCEKLVVTKPV